MTAAIDRGKSLGVDLVLGMGGGSVMDSAKVLAAMLPGQTGLMAHLEVIGDGLPLSAMRLPLTGITWSTLNRRLVSTR
ncbi:iron-containing alcohol dehydrogenase [Marinobacter vulgaris]|uniref:iron-containing alcohol dehydrogenase n=1 Tax=Marinobacter vulgaris TaxID=1928331 RepID=UPI001FCB4808|nr:iron-containing alcohol dehydrogenase [Marinobacter vulgaris]